MNVLQLLRKPFGNPRLTTSEAALPRGMSHSASSARVRVRPSMRTLFLLLTIATTVPFANPGVYSADYYFSDCATGCRNNPDLTKCSSPGTLANPYCLDPGNDGRKDSIMYLFDGTAPDASPGDTINLCAGACDGAGAATYRPDCTTTTADGSNTRNVWFVPQVSGMQAQPIVIQNYPGETIFISGDRNGDDVYQSPGAACNPGSSDLDVMGKSNGKKWITWKGNDVAGQKGITFEKLGEGAWWFVTNGDGGASGWVFDGITIQLITPGFWSGIPDANIRSTLVTPGYTPTTNPSTYPGVSAGVPHYIHAGNISHTSGCTSGGAQRGFYVNKMDTGDPFTVKNGLMRHICGFAHRNIGNNPENATNGPGGSEFLFEKNEYYNLGFVSNEVYNLGSLVKPGSHFTYRNNYMHDVMACAPGIEQDNDGIVAEDNRCYCLGEWILEVNGRCERPFYVEPGGNATVKNITFRRNMIFSKSTGGTNISNPGWFGEGLGIHITCDSSYVCATSGLPCGCSKSNIVVENNLIWNMTQGSYTTCREAAICVDGKSAGTGNGSIVVQNNTIYKTNGQGKGIAVFGNATHKVKNNIVSLAVKEELLVDAGTASSEIIFNNLCDSSGTVMNLGGILKTCTQTEGFQNNRCGTSLFQNVSGDPRSWNLRLASEDSANKNMGTSGALDDIDKTLRDTFPPTDIGAYEVTTGNSSTLPAPTNLRRADN